MITIAKMGSAIPNYEKIYKQFAQSCFSTPENLDMSKKAFLTTRDIFMRGRVFDKFGEKTEKLVPELLKSGYSELANIFLTEIAKIHLGRRNYTTAERFVTKALELSKAGNDNFHVIARLNDLQEIYKETRNRHRYFEVLNEKKAYLKETISNYDEYLKKYHSIHRSPTRLSSLKIQLAYVYSDISDLLKHNRIEHSIRACQKALDIYKELGMPTQIKYLEIKLQRLIAKSTTKYKF